MDNSLYHYKAAILRVIDGDTIDVRIDLGFGITRQERVRVAGIDTPEINSKELWVRVQAEEARLTVVHWINTNPTVYLKTVKPREKYGRYLAEVFSLSGESLGKLLVDKGLATPLSYT